MSHVRPVTALLAAAAVLALAGCTGSTGSTPPTSPNPSESSASAEPRTVRVVTHDSFALSESVVAAFEESSGISVEFIPAGDAGEMVNRAVLSSGNPEADVLFGIDTTLLSRAIDAEVFDPYLSSPDALRPELSDAGIGIVTPVDDGDVCVNIDDAWFADRGLPPPATLEDLTDPRYRGQLVVQNPATSSPGLAFLLATIARYGDAWPDYWERLRANDVAVVNGWSEAYLSEFTAGGGDGERPLVVSYSTSPPAEIVYAEEPKPERPSTSVMLDGCYRQVEFAGVLRGTPDVESARAVVDWLVSPEVQADVPLSMFVFPARDGVALPEVFERFVTRPGEPLEIAAEEIAEKRDEWIDQWTQVVLR